MGFSALIDSYDNFFIGQAPKAVIDQLLMQLPDARDRILKYSPNMQQRLESFEFHLRQDIYSNSYTDIQYMLNGIQSVHPELNIQEIYRIYYPDAV